MEVLTSKLVALTLLGSLTLVMGLAPIKLYALLRSDSNANNASGKTADAHRRRKVADLIVTCLLHFGGGVLVSTSFLHMIPEVRENLDAAVKEGAFPRSKYPFPELLVCIGFFFVYTVELIAHSCVQHQTKHHNTVSACPTVDHVADDQAETKLCPAVLESGGARVSSPLPEESNGSPPKDTSTKITYGSVEAIGLESGMKNPTGSNKENIHIAVFRGSLIIAALSFHSIFEGMAVGLQPSSSDVWTLFAAIAIHKLVIAFCVGLELIAMGTHLIVMILQIVVFAIVSPIGIGIGIVVMESTAGAADTNALVIGVFQGLAAGTLIYVTFFEVLLKDKDREAFAFLKLACELAGFTTIAAVHVIE